MKLTKEEEARITKMLNRTDVLDEVARVRKLDNLEQQGYELAPLMCRLTGCTPSVLLGSVLASPEPDPMNRLRDNGVKRWCIEQLKGGANDEHADS